MKSNIDEAGTLAERITRSYLKKMFISFVKQQLVYVSDFNPPELKREVLTQAYRLIAPGIKRTIIPDIEDMCGCGQKININGYIAFRMGKFKYRTLDGLAQILESTVAKLKYERFIKLLRYYVENAAAAPESDNSPAVHLYPAAAGAALTVVHGSNVLTHTIMCSDTLLDTLIELLPAKIYIHEPHDYSNLNILRTILNVFTNRVELANDLC